MSAPGYLSNFVVWPGSGTRTGVKVLCKLCDETVITGDADLWKLADAAQHHDRTCTGYDVTNVTA